MIYRNPESYGSLGFMAPLSEANAYNGLDQARLGGWQANFGGGKLWKNDPEYLQKWAPETRFVPQWAHCDYFQSESVKPDDWPEEAQTFHYVALSNPKDEKHLQDMYESWIQQGAYDVFARKLGYRFRLISASVEDQVKSGNKLSIQLDMTNDGWASPTNPRILEIVMRNLSSGKEYPIRLRPKEDLRLWLSGPGRQKKLTIDSIIPATLPLGQYSILLNLPDPEPRLYDDPRYKIRLASTYDGSSIWKPSTGYNNLHLNVTIEP